MTGLRYALVADETLLLGVSVRVFPGEISVWISRLSKDLLSPVGNEKCDTKWNHKGQVFFNGTRRPLNRWTFPTCYLDGTSAFGLRETTNPDDSEKTPKTWCVCVLSSPGKNIEVGCHFLLQEIFLTQGLNPCLLCLLYWQAYSLPLCHLGNPQNLS